MIHKTEWLILASLLTVIILVGLSAFLDVHKGLRDSKRRADIGIIANAVEIHYNTKLNEFCSDAPIGSYCHPQYSWFSGGVPLDPLRGDYINLPQNGDKEFLICAKLERGEGNASTTDGTLDKAKPADYYCQKNQQ
jgi:hypothetical protein